VAAVLWTILPSSLQPRIDHTDTEAVELGRRIYAETCASCHGTNLEGQRNWRERLPNGKMPAPPHDASGHTWHHRDTALFQITKKGPAAYPKDYPTDMPGFSGRLSDDEIAAVLAFIKSTWPPDILKRQTRLR
jgi:mono/diheme cytochrome c family protein